VVKSIIQKANAAGKANVLPVGALTRGLAGQQIAEMAGLKEAGCVAVGNAAMPIVDSVVMRRAMEYAVSCNLSVFLYSEDAFLGGKGCAHEGPVATRLGLSSIPEIAETLAVTRDIALAQLTGARVHFCKISTAGAVELIRQAQARGLPVTANVTAHHLHLLDIDVAGFDSNYHVRPPLRSQRDRDALRQGLADGVISAICSDHQPHDLDAKLGPFSETESGISSFGTLLPLSLRLVADGLLSLPQMIATLTASPAKVLNLDSGRLNPGSPADVCIFYQDKYWTADSSHWLSRGQNSPLYGRELQGRVIATICNGRLVYADIATH
jgi:dihydroorotase